MFCFCCRPPSPDRRGFFADAAASPTEADAAIARRAAYQRRKSFSRAPVAHPEPTEFIVRNACLLTMDPHIGDIPNGDVHVRDGLIVNLGPGLTSSALHEIDGRGAIALPGFVATHRHLLSEALARHASTSFRGVRPQAETNPESRDEGHGDDSSGVRVHVAAARLMPRNDGSHHAAPIDHGGAEAADVYCALRLMMLDALSCGITALHHCGYQLDPEFAEIAIMAQRDVGLHGRFSYPVAFDQPDAVVPEEAAELAQRWCASDDEPLSFGLACKPDDAPAIEQLAPPWPVTADHSSPSYDSLAGRTRDAARALQLDDEIGSLAPGKRADIILMAAGDASTPQQAMQIAHEVPPASIRLVSIDGRLRKRNGVLADPNEGLIRSEGRAALARLRSLVSEPTGVLLS